MMTSAEQRTKGQVSAIIAVAIIIGSTVIVLNTINPFIEEGRASQTFIEAKNALSAIDQIIQQLSVESVGARRQIDVDLPAGRFIVAGDEERLKIRLPESLSFDPGAQAEEGNIKIAGGGKITASEKDIDSDGNTDLVLENEALKFAIKKIGSADSWASLNTSTMITVMENSRTGTNITPSSGIFINDRTDTAVGTGYTKLTDKGTNIESSSILVFVNSSSGITYEALFTLRAGSDFVELTVKNITGV